MKLEVGKEYKTRGGEVVRIHRIGHPDQGAEGMEFYQFSGEHPRFGLQGWRADGRFSLDGVSSFDLVDEFTGEQKEMNPASSASGPGDVMHVYNAASSTATAALRILLREIDARSLCGRMEGNSALADAVELARLVISREST